MKNYKIAIVGGGPSGMMSAIKAAQELGPNTVCLIEKTDSLGKKLLLTGGGRCNITNNTPVHDQLNYYNENKKFLKHSIYTLPPEKLLAIFEEKNLEFHEEDKKRVFPDTEDSESILNILKEYLEELEVDIYYNIKIDEDSIEHELNEKMEAEFLINSENSETKETIAISSERLILATGGITYPNTGSTGDGYKIAEKFSHTTTPIKPGLASFKIDDFLLTSLSGLNLENVEVSFKNNKKKISKKGDVLISHNGLTGPAIIDLSNKLMEVSDYNLLDNNENELKTNIISIDFCPEKTEDDIRNQITNDTPNHGTTKIKNYMKYFLANNLIDYFLMTLQVSSHKTMANLSKKDKNQIVANLKHFNFEIDEVLEDTAKITIGGIQSSEIKSKSLESKYVDGLYFAGELLEVAGPTGGYNLEIAFSTGYLAGQEASKSLK